MIILNPFMGISGDMFLSAMVDFVDEEELINTIKKVVDVDVEIKKVKKRDIIANKINIVPKGRLEDRNYKDIKKLIKNSNINENIKKHALNMFKILAESEAKVHGVNVEKVHFHEVGQVDTIADIVGAAYCIEKLKNEEFYYTPINVGSGFVNTEHGKMPVPAPATLEILRGFEIFFSKYGELTTPTGATIIKYLNPKLAKSTFSVEKISYGAGDRDFEAPNVLRIIKAKDDFKDEVCLIETNVDDVSSEILGYLYEVLKDKVRDLHFIPCFMKKNRPAYMIRIIANVKDIDDICEILMQETGTIGIRVIPYVHRSIAKREFKTINVFGEDVKVKVSYFNGKIVSKKPEFEDLKKVAKKHNLPLKDVYLEVIKKI
jgi:uncharacterized protein (TIGR00299 family) protein